MCLPSYTRDVTIRSPRLRIAIGSIATLDLPMVVDLIGIYGLKGPYCTLTTTNWFLQALSVIPRGSWGDVARRFTMIRWATSTRRRRRRPSSPENFFRPIRRGESVRADLVVLLVQADEGVPFLVVDRIGDIYRNLPRRADVIVTTVGARHKCQQGISDSACKNQLVMVSVQFSPFNTYIPIRSTTIGTSRVARDLITMHTSRRSNSDITCVNSIGYPHIKASRESSTTKHRLLHTSGPHPIPPPNDPNRVSKRVKVRHLSCRVSMTFRVVRTNQYNQDLGLIHSINGNHLESPNEGSSIDHQVTIHLHAQNITMFPTNETWYFTSQMLVSSSGGLIIILTAQSTRNEFRIHINHSAHGGYDPSRKMRVRYCRSPSHPGHNQQARPFHIPATTIIEAITSLYYKLKSVPYTEQQLTLREIPKTLEQGLTENQNVVLLSRRNTRTAATSRSSTSQLQLLKLVRNGRASREESNATSHEQNNHQKPREFTGIAHGEQCSRVRRTKDERLEISKFPLSYALSSLAPFLGCSLRLLSPDACIASAFYSCCLLLFYSCSPYWGLTPCPSGAWLFSLFVLFSGNPGFTAGRGFNPAGGAPGGV
ncbi:MIT family transporter: magnesium/cobalt ion [Dorcoceras hygrometricum]|uniref:MIT family transporter: magnesium/cobalt ion n=1 Tax=Dorcoceras hygrometricum TaxID=472368 RepID=A0A2Z7CUG6_9LAMI|nr:MIT family transporter: magnesium/cobalt ion [Dorcoceras hygrometricum]